MKHECFLYPMMDGVVHVRPAGTPYPFTQAQYNRQANDEGQELLADGRALAREVREDSDSHHVDVGADDGMAMVMLFFPGTVTIDVGDTIVFRDNYPTDDPHTVTFGQPPQAFPPIKPYGDADEFVGQNLNSDANPHHPQSNQQSSPPAPLPASQV
jgi:plastocyanin